METKELEMISDFFCKSKLTCKCIESQWIPTNIEDFSENVRGKAKRNGDLYINVM